MIWGDFMRFSERIKHERQLRGLTLLDVSSDCEISESQLYKIENYEVNVTNSTLLKMARYYGYDIIKNYYKIIDDSMVQILLSINQDIQARNINNIKKSLDIINQINNNSTNIIISSICKQYYHLINGLICLEHNNYISARESFLGGIKSFNPFIDTNNFNNIGSSNLQLRLLMAYAITFKASQDYEKCLHLLNIVSTNTRNDDLISKKTTYNIANLYSLIQKYDKSINVLDNHLNFHHSNNINYNNIIYFKKATVSYHIGHDDYEKYAMRCLYTSALSKDTVNGLIFLNVFNKLFDNSIMTKEKFLKL